MSTRTWKRFVAMLLASIMTFTMLPMGVLAEEPVVADDQQVAATMDLEQPVEEPAEEPAAEPTEAERLMAKIDNMLLRYLGDRFKGNDRNNEEIVAEVNKLSRSEIVATFLAVLEMCKTGSVRLEDDISGENPNVRMLDKKEGGEIDGTN